MDNLASTPDSRAASQALNAHRFRLVDFGPEAFRRAVADFAAVNLRLRVRARRTSMRMASAPRLNTGSFVVLGIGLARRVPRVADAGRTPKTVQATA